MLLTEMKLDDVIRMDYMKSGFNLARVIRIDDDGVMLRRAFVHAVCNESIASSEDCFFMFSDTRIADGTWFSLSERFASLDEYWKRS